MSFPLIFLYFVKLNRDSKDNSTSGPHLSSVDEEGFNPCNDYWTQSMKPAFLYFYSLYTVNPCRKRFTPDFSISGATVVM